MSKQQMHTAGPWYVLDFRASHMRSLGWTGPAVDRILITNKTNREIEACAGADAVVARIQFDNRDGELSESNLADANLIAAAPDLLAALQSIVALMGNVDHSKGGGENAARMYGGMLMDIKALGLAAIAKAQPSTGETQP